LETIAKKKKRVGFIPHHRKRRARQEKGEESGLDRIIRGVRKISKGKPPFILHWGKTKMGEKARGKRRTDWGSDRN